jgi:hypothetical protein
MKYIFIFIVKAVLLVYAVAFVIPLFFVIFLIVWAWSLDLKLALALGLLPWQKQTIEYWTLQRPVCWHKLPHNTNIEYPSIIHQMLGLNPTYVKLPEAYEDYFNLQPEKDR